MNSHSHLKSLENLKKEAIVLLMNYRTRQQQAVREVLRNEGHPLTAAEIHEQARKIVPRIGQATVYRALSKMSELGDVQVIEAPGFAPHYELTGHHHHHFFACRSCDKLYDLPGCTNNLAQLLPQGFQMTDHEIFIFGSCQKCAN